MAKGITLKDKNGGTLYPKTVADLVLDSETGEPIGKVISSMGKIKADDEKKWLRVEGEEGKRYFVALTELDTPDPPTLAETKYYVVTGDCNIKVTPPPTGVTIEYSTDDGATWNQITSKDNTFTFATGYTNDGGNGKIELTVLLRAEKNGEVSKEVSAKIEINPQVASGSVSVKRNNKDNKYSTSADITLTPSQTVGAESKYSSDKGNTWKDLKNPEVITVYTSQEAGQYQVKATKAGGVYVDATTVKSGIITLNALKAYYGAGGDTITAGGVKDLGNSIEADTYSGSIEFTTAETSYIWLCCASALGKVYSDEGRKFEVPFNPAQQITVDGQTCNCYRSTGQIVADKHKFYF